VSVASAGTHVNYVHLLQADNLNSKSSLNFYRPAALLDIQATVSKHRLKAIIQIKIKNINDHLTAFDPGQPG